MADRSTDILGQLRQELEAMKAQGHEAVRIDTLIDALSPSSPPMRREFQEQIYLAQYSVAASDRQSDTEEHTQFNRFAIETGQSAIKAAMLTNGGAAVAILAFVGNAWAKGMAPEPLTEIANSLGWFAFGVLTAALASGFAYLVQRLFVEGFGKAESRWNRAANLLNVGAIVVVLASYGFFGRGIWVAYQAMKLLAKASSVEQG